jgi:hypothetical protein
MPYHDMSPLSTIINDELVNCSTEELISEIKLFRKALEYCRSQDGDDNCWMDYRHLLMRFLPGYNSEKDDVILDVNQLENCKNFIKCWQNNQSWDCLGGDKGKKSTGPFNWHTRLPLRHEVSAGDIYVLDANSSDSNCSGSLFILSNKIDLV